MPAKHVSSADAPSPGHTQHWPGAHLRLPCVTHRGHRHPHRGRAGGPQPPAHRRAAPPAATRLLTRSPGTAAALGRAAGATGAHRHEGTGARAARPRPALNREMAAPAAAGRHLTPSPPHRLRAHRSGERTTQRTAPHWERSPLRWERRGGLKAPPADRPSGTARHGGGTAHPPASARAGPGRVPPPL